MHPRGMFAAFMMFALLTALSVLPAAARKRDTGFLNRTVTVNGVTYRFQVYVPADWDRHTKQPVLMFLHGSGERGDDGLVQTQVGLGTAIREQSAIYRFLVVMPQCRKDKLWTDADMQSQALAALEQVIHEFKGDRNALYLTGLSMGGYGTWEIAMKNPRIFAAIAPVCGGLHGTKDLPDMHSSLLNDPKISDPYAETARRISSTPVWVFHGDADPSVPVEESRKMVEALKAAKANVRYSEYPGVGHNSWDNAYAEKEFVPWLLTQHLSPNRPYLK